MGGSSFGGLWQHARALTLLCAFVASACEPGHEPAPPGASDDIGGADDEEPPPADEPAPEIEDASAPEPTAPDAAPALPLVSSEIQDAGRDAAELPVVDAAPPVDPCGPVPTSGRCQSASQLELCAVATGASAAHVEQITCAADERCVEADARARCMRVESCSTGATRCTASGLETCVAARWQASACANECVETPLGAFCADPAPTRLLSGRVQYERRLPNRTLSDWDAPALSFGRGFLVLSYHGEELVDAVLSASSDADAGRFSLRVREPSSQEDSLVVMAAGADADQQLAYAVADPGFSSSTRAREVGKRTDAAAIWSYRFDVRQLDATNSLTILEKHGSAACHVFDRLRQVYALGRDHYRPSQPERVLVWVGLGTEWSCGACSSLSPTRVFDTTFTHQVWLDGSRDQGYWSDPVTAHELGHYVMNAYGYPAGEGGPHYLGIPTHPGQAFSEGWATFFASLARADTVYFDKQGGAFFWWDLDRRAYSVRSVLWARAVAALGLLQRMDENEVAAIMWQNYRALGAAAPLLDALASERMTRAPFARGYTRRVWDDAEQPDDYTSTTQPLPYLADYLDALRCDGAFEAAALRAILEPTTYFPYPSESPLCD